MKIKTYIVLFILLAGIFLPVQIYVSRSPGNAVSLFSLDVCDASGDCLSLQDDDMPFVCECSGGPAPVDKGLVFEYSSQIFSPFLVVFQLERPPEV